MNTRVVLPHDVQEFLSSRIESYDELEVLVALQRRPGVSCPLRTISSCTQLPESRVQLAAEALCQRGLALATPLLPTTFQYAPADAETDALVLQLAAIYEKRKLDVIRAMTATALERFRRCALRTFGAFVASRKYRA